ncbi:MAG: biopolymer transport protein ExbD [Myxococcota bacterium]|jgi:biopolymer transport protein ExbD
MAFGGSRDDDEGFNDINVVPLVDIMLVLLIIFMVTTEFVQDRFEEVTPPPNVPVQLPRASSAEDTNKSLLSLAINKDGQLFLNGNETDLVGVEAYVKDMKQKGAKLEAFVAADERLTHGAVIRVIDKIRLLGIPDVAINTKPLEIE